MDSCSQVIIIFVSLFLLILGIIFISPKNTETFTTIIGLNPLTTYDDQGSIDQIMGRIPVNPHDPELADMIIDCRNDKDLPMINPLPINIDGENNYGDAQFENGEIWLLNRIRPQQSAFPPQQLIS